MVRNERERRACLRTGRQAMTLADEVESNRGLSSTRAFCLTSVPQ